jgi:ferredoxin
VTPLLFEDVTDFPEAIHDVELLGVGFPTFFGYPPKFIVDMLDGLRKVNGTSAFVFTTYGGATAGDSLYDAASALAKKGYRIVGGLKMEGADNYPQGIALGLNAGRPNVVDMEIVDDFAEKMLEAHKSGRSLDPASLASPTDFFKKNRGKPKAKVLENLHKPVEGKIIFDQTQCLFCETCKKSCPTKSIKTGEKFPDFTWKCIDGMRCFQCIRVCPGKALSAEYPGTLEDYRKFWETIADSPEEKRRAFVVA